MTRQQQRALGMRVAEDARAGMHMHTLCDKYGMNYGRVRSWCKKFDAIPVSCTCLMQRVSIYRIIAALQNDIPQATIAKSMGVSRQRVNEVSQKAIAAGIT